MTHHFSESFPQQLTKNSVPNEVLEFRPEKTIRSDKLLDLLKHVVQIWSSPAYTPITFCSEDVQVVAAESDPGAAKTFLGQPRQHAKISSFSYGGCFSPFPCYSGPWKDT